MIFGEFLADIGFQVNSAQFKDAENSINSLGNLGKKVLGAIGIGFSLNALKNFTRQSIMAASTAEQMEMKFDTVFDSMRDSADTWAEDLADSIGRSKSTIKTYLADIQNLLYGMSDGSDESRLAMAELSEQMVQSAIDIASFTNIDDDVAVNAMSKALLGQSEAAKRLGAVLNDNTIATAMETMGLKGKFNALDEATKMQVRYTAIMNQSRDSIGDAARSIDTYEGQSRKLKASSDALRTSIGKMLIPAAKEGLKSINYIVDSLKSVVKWLGDIEDENSRISRFTKPLGDFLERIGGIENLVRVLMYTLIALGGIKLWTALPVFLTKVKALLTVAHLKVLGIIGAVFLLALVVDDIINFMQGNESAIGVLFDTLGISAEDARNTISSAVNIVKSILGGLLYVVQEVFGLIKSIFTLDTEEGTRGVVLHLTNLLKFLGGILLNILGLITDILAMIVVAIADKIAEIWNNITSTVSGWVDAAKTWGSDFIDGLVNGISNGIEKVKTAVTNVGNAIWEKLHFSKPENGPLADYESWMPDMMATMSVGIKENIPKVIDEVRAMANEINALMASTQANMKVAATGMINTTKTVTQNVNINNSYSGGNASTQKTVSKAMNKSAKDATTLMARSLSYAR